MTRFFKLLLHYIDRRLDKDIDDEDTLKYLIFFAHDLNLLHISSFLDLQWDYSYVDFASTIFFEVHRLEIDQLEDLAPYITEEDDCYDINNKNKKCYEIRVFVNGLKLTNNVPFC